MYDWVNRHGLALTTWCICGFTYIRMVYQIRVNFMSLGCGVLWCFNRCVVLCCCDEGVDVGVCSVM